jgi:hypothetical protein
MIDLRGRAAHALYVWAVRLDDLGVRIGGSDHEGCSPRFDAFDAGWDVGSKEADGFEAGYENAARELDPTWSSRADGVPNGPAAIAVPARLDA